MNKNYKKLLKKLKIKYIDPDILTLAFTHSSVKQEKTNQFDNDRLEYLGDAVLKLAVSDWLYNTYPDYSEGKMSKIGAYILSDVTLANVARLINLGDYINFSLSEKKSGGKNRTSNLASAMEALIGAVFLSTNYRITADMVIRLMIQELKSAILEKKAEEENYKALLQELTQEQYNCLPEYEIINTDGSDHSGLFKSIVKVRGEILGSGEGRTKKYAQQQAAKSALESLTKNHIKFTKLTFSSKKW